MTEGVEIMARLYINGEPATMREAHTLYLRDYQSQGGDREVGEEIFAAALYQNATNGDWSAEDARECLLESGIEVCF